MKKLLVSLGAAAVILGGTTAVTFAAIPDSSGSIHSCYNNGLLPSFRIINSSSQTCGLGETSLNWTQSGGTYAVFGGTDTLVSNSSGIITHAPSSAGITSACQSSEIADKGILTLSGNGVSSVFGYSFIYEGDQPNLTTFVDTLTNNIGFPVGSNIGIPNVDVTFKYYAVCLPVPTLPS